MIVYKGAVVAAWGGTWDATSLTASGWGGTPGKVGLLLETQLMGTLYLQPCSELLLRLKDQENFISFIFDKKGNAVQLIYHNKSIQSGSKQY